MLAPQRLPETVSLKDGGLQLKMAMTGARPFITLPEPKTSPVRDRKTGRPVVGAGRSSAEMLSQMEASPIDSLSKPLELQSYTNSAAHMFALHP